MLQSEDERGDRPEGESRRDPEKLRAAAADITCASTALEKFKRDEAERCLANAIDALARLSPREDPLPSQFAEEAIDLLSRVSDLGVNGDFESDSVVPRQELEDLATRLVRSATRASYLTRPSNDVSGEHPESGRLADS